MKIPILSCLNLAPLCQSRPGKTNADDRHRERGDQHQHKTDKQLEYMIGHL